MQSSETAIFALGGFWEPEYACSKLPGVTHTQVGYTGGTSGHPAYHDIGDHCEVVQVDFDPHRISYEELLDKFWQLHDPTAAYEQRFHSVVFYLDETQRHLAGQSKQRAQTHYRDPIRTDIIPAGKFWPAEAYNQHYMAKLRGE